MKTVIIGHRGAAGIALENSSNAIKKAVDLGVPMIEIDVRLTSDKKLLVNHDADLLRTANDPRKLADHTFDELKNVKLNDGSTILTLEQALKLAGSTHVMIELKDETSEYALLDVLEKFPETKVSIASFKINQLAVLRELSPTMELFALEHSKAIEIVEVARRLKLSGIAISFWVLSPHIYWLARRHKLQIYTYTVNRRFVAWLFGILYPHAMICTDHPEWFMPQKKRRKSAAKVAQRPQAG